MSNIRRWLALAVVGMMGVAGCELAVEFDRTKIDSGTFDASISETSTDAPVLVDALGDGTAADSATDARDAASDTTTDVVIDTAVSDANDAATTPDADDASDAG